MTSDTESLSREDLYERHNMPSAGRFFATHILPVFEWSIDVESEIETETQHEVLAEIALWKAFNKEPKTKPFVILTSQLLLYDYLYSLPFGVYGLSIVGLATLSGLMSGIRGRRLLAAEYAQKRDEHGIPAGMHVSAANVASSTVTLVFVAIGVSVQMLATSGLIGTELLMQNRMAGGPVPPIVTILIFTFTLYLYGYLRR